MATTAYDHVVEIDEGQRRLTIYRLMDGRRQLFSSVGLPQQSAAGDPAGFKDFCRLLGENILLDSPQARRLLGL